MPGRVRGRKPGHGEIGLEVGSAAFVALQGAFTITLASGNMSTSALVKTTF